MKKIIEHGFKYHMETRCPYCGCKFSYEWTDVLKPNDQWIYSTNTKITTTYPIYQIICPECNSQFNIYDWQFTDYRDIKITCCYMGDTNED